jgi:crotonobetainyl-CoA:carnitine CoA-transferase CaiB-like acyl-CoA transferase
MSETAVQPLAGLMVLELGQYIAGPYAGMVLADLGARVIKVEPPAGDGIRTWGPHVGGESAPFMAFNRNKEDITADYRLEEERELIDRLMGEADIIIENNRPGVLSRYGLDARSARRRHPHLIYCSITGYASRGHDPSRAGFDLVIQGSTGLMSVTGAPESPISKIGVPIVDGTAALHATTAILAALHERERTGAGAEIEIALNTVNLTWMMLLASRYFATGEEPERLGSAHPLAAPYQAFRTGTSPITIAAGNERQWQRACEVLGLEHLREDERFITNADRACNQAELAEIVQQRLLERSRDAMIAELSAAGVPCGPVNTLGEALEDPAIPEDLLISYEHPVAGPARAIGSPITIDRSSPAFRRPPLRGEHTQAIADEFGARAAALAFPTEIDESAADER